jgi:hypothetical protein
MAQHLQIELTEKNRTALLRLTPSDNAPGRTNTSACAALERPQSRRGVHGPGSCGSGFVSPEYRRQRPQTLGREGSESLTDRGWPGAKPKLTDDLKAKRIMLPCSVPPKGHACWLLRLPPSRMVEPGPFERVSHVTVREWLQDEIGLGGWLLWCSNKPSPPFVAKGKDARDVYQRPDDPSAGSLSGRDQQGVEGDASGQGSPGTAGRCLGSIRQRCTQRAGLAVCHQRGSPQAHARASSS